MIRCGHCQARHETVELVRACSGSRTRKVQRKGRQKRRSRDPGRNFTAVGTSTAMVFKIPEPRAPDPGKSALNNMGAGRTRDVTMWERDERERQSLERLRRLNQQEY